MAKTSRYLVVTAAVAVWANAHLLGLQDEINPVPGRELAAAVNLREFAGTMP
ncbi:MAG TPA: hypothetical protein VHJ58_22635 [Vicinamibacterales bacterium]|jgi:hypothetical protein|nr:hypothetical protein [Vicinamibacterales bacterium]